MNLSLALAIVLDSAEKELNSLRVDMDHNVDKQNIKEFANEAEKKQNAIEIVSNLWRIVRKA